LYEAFSLCYKAISLFHPCSFATSITHADFFCLATFPRRRLSGSDKISDGSSRTEESDLSEKNYEMKAKRVFLEQLDGLNDRLCEMYVELVDSDEVNEAKDWQRILLGLSAKETGIIGRFLTRAYSSAEVYAVDENLERK